MGSLNVKYYEVDIVKTGKISKHNSTKRGKKYSRGKVYLTLMILSQVDNIN